MAIAYDGRMPANEIAVDSRGRTSLAKARSSAYEHYRAEELPDGTLILTPVVMIDATELAALRNPEVRTVLEADRESPDPQARWARRT